MSPDSTERRRNQPLRELLDEMITLARRLSHGSEQFSPAELDYAHERMEWLAGEIWEQAVRPPDQPS
ncbi:MAG TPA: hypothetical protein VFK16_07670 [Gemmatimonadaceae bacterium]|jgi:hypothetical protein|nr:hypothetical protein [Gemmatimonadaceae bacterium]